MIEAPLAVKFQPSSVSTEVVSLLVCVNLMFTYGDKLSNKGFSTSSDDTDVHVIEDGGTLIAVQVAMNVKESETLFNTMSSNGCSETWGRARRQKQKHKSYDTFKYVKLTPSTW